VNGIEAAFHGRLGRDAEFKLVKGGTLPLTTLVVAVTAQGQDKATWIRTVCFGDLAEQVRDLPKGEIVTVEGRLTLDHWTAGDGSERSGLSVVAQVARRGYHKRTDVKPKVTKPKPAKIQGRRAGAPDPDLNDDIPDLVP
jgi:single-stranded DNA-binding protein